MYRSSRSDEELESLSESLVRESAPTALALIEHLYKRNRASKFSDPETGRQRRMEQKMLVSLMSRVQDRSDESVEFCQLLTASENFVNNVFCDMLKMWSSDYLNGKLDDVCIELMFKVITVVYNCLFKNDSFVITNLATINLAKVVRPLLKSPESARSLQALLLMVFALDESQADLFLSESDVIRLLVDGLRESLSSKERSFETGNMVYSLPELAKCTQRLALNDVNKGLLMKLGVLPAVRTMLEAAEPRDVVAGLELALTLSFERDRKLKLELGAEIWEPLRRLAATQNQEMSQTLQGLLFNMGEKFTLKVLGGRVKDELNTADAGTTETPPVVSTGSTPVSKAAEAASVKEVVIGYHPEQQDFVRSLRENLLRLGVSVWVDFKDAPTGASASMTETRSAVDASRVFVMCMSRRYKESNTCRLYAEYAANMKKLLVPVIVEANYVPTGWLGQLCTKNTPLPGDAKVATEICKRLSNRASAFTALR